MNKKGMQTVRLVKRTSASKQSRGKKTAASGKQNHLFCTFLSQVFVTFLMSTIVIAFQVRLLLLPVKTNVRKGVSSYPHQECLLPPQKIYQFLKGKVLRCFVVGVFPFCLSSAIEPCKVMHGFGNVCLAWFAGMILIRLNVYEAASLAMANKYF